jgi:hypothetical protein
VGHENLRRFCFCFCFAFAFAVALVFALALALAFAVALAFALAFAVALSFVLAVILSEAKDPDTLTHPQPLEAFYLQPQPAPFPTKAHQSSCHRQAAFPPQSPSN